jgi:hypothetical protein
MGTAGGTGERVVVGTGEAAQGREAAPHGRRHRGPRLRRRPARLEAGFGAADLSRSWEILWLWLEVGDKSLSLSLFFFTLVDSPEFSSLYICG